jgi:hypothetical protein
MGREYRTNGENKDRPENPKGTRKSSCDNNIRMDLKQTEYSGMNSTSVESGILWTRSLIFCFDNSREFIDEMNTEGTHF